jgi:hypothetical protein
MLKVWKNHRRAMLKHRREQAAVDRLAGHLALGINGALPSAKQPTTPSPADTRLVGLGGDHLVIYVALG